MSLRSRLALATTLVCLALTVPVGLIRAAEPPGAAEPLGIALEGFAYPHPVSLLPVVQDGEDLRMAYMDVPPVGPANGRAVLLLHGRNFPASYWEPTIAALARAGYRVVVPDQIGFGKSSKPGSASSFDAMARATASLLDTLGLAKVDVVGHSMGGMLAVRFVRTYPERAQHLVLEAPIGLEDYRFTVPPVETERLLAQERDLTADAYRRQLVQNYAVAAPEAIEPFVAMRERIRASAEYPRWLRSFVHSYQMIHGQPVVHEIPLIRHSTLFVMGANDHNAPGRPFAPSGLRAGMGENAKLAQDLAARMPAGRAVVLDGIGHLVHMEAQARFNELLLGFLAEP